MPVALYSGEADVKDVDTFAYLGCLMTDNCNVVEEVNSHIDKASRALSLLCIILWYLKRI